MKQILESLESIVTVVLVFAGIIGISYRGFRNGGWVEQGFGKVAGAYSQYPIIALALTIAGVYGYIKFRQRKRRDGRSKIFDYIIYALMAAGIYFIGNYVVTGKF
jgi:hypothetical protein